MENSKCLLIIGFVFPEPASSAAGSRMVQLIELFISQGFDITFASPASDSEFAFELEKLGIKKVSITLNDASFDDFVVQLNPEIVLFDRFLMEEQFGWRVSENCPNALKILDTEDLHCLRKARQNAWKSKIQFQTEMLFSETAKREIASILRCDLSLIISEFEMEILQNVFQVSPTILHYLPLFVDEKLLAQSKDLPTFNDRNHFIFIGNFLHEPNWNAVLYLKESIWPKIKQKLPESELHIYGAYASQKVLNLNNSQQGFWIKNRAEDVYEVMSSARVCLAPLRFGAGIKGKILDSMVSGTPNVTSKIGSESMHGEMQWGGIIAENTEDFVKGAVELFTNNQIWEKAQLNGFEICKKRYSKSIFETEFSALIYEIKKDVVKRRQLNFMGEILKHHSLSSTKFMSKWIEEKNKKLKLD